MIVKEKIGNNLIKTYSDSGFYIFGGDPESKYVEAIDFIEDAREYIELDEKYPVYDSEGNLIEEI